MSDLSSVYREARRLISDPARWTQGASARNGQGLPLARGRSQGAVCWCAEGALDYCALVLCDDRDEAEDLYDEAVEFVNRMAGENNVLWRLNDGAWPRAPEEEPYRHRRVLRALDEAARLAREGSL